MTNTQAQCILEGSIVGPESQWIEGAVVYLSDSSQVVTTDQFGQFRFNPIPAGTVTIKARARRYHPGQLTVTLNDYTDQGGYCTEKVTVFLAREIIEIEDVLIRVSMANPLTPTTYTNLKKEDIDSRNFGQDLPILLEQTPSAVSTSDAGTGIGYTGVRIRGVDPTRTNVTINGIPINDAESHAVYWVNMPDLGSSTDLVQVQRGVGTSTNGAAAFGASINLQTDKSSIEPYAMVDNSFGAFQTMRNTLRASTGLMHDRFTLDMRLSRLSSDGYVDRASANLKSMFVSGNWKGRKYNLKGTVFSGVERTYQSWYGVPQAKLSVNPDSLLTHFYNNYYPGGLYQSAEDSINLFDSDNRTYNYYRYKNEVDQYQQDHYQLHYNYTFDKGMQVSLAGHYTRGRGYYEQFRQNDPFATYGLDTLFIGNDTIANTDLIRRRWLDNHFYGALASMQGSIFKKLFVQAGVGFNRYDGDHFGEITWAQFASQSAIEDRYYENNAVKTEANGYIKMNYTIKKLNLFADMQVRHLSYSYLGVDQSFGNLVPLQQEVAFTFYNPKVGFLIYLPHNMQFYTSYAVGNREPVRDDFVQSTPNSRPQPEQLHNGELGLRMQREKWSLITNAFGMYYKNQLILTGEINDVGAYVRTNVDQSYRAGIEVEGRYEFTRQWSIKGNVTWSQHKIMAFNEYIDNYDNYDAEGNMIQTVIAHKNTDIAFSPNVVSALGLHFNPREYIQFALNGKYVGKQFLDNTSSDSRMIEAYFTLSFQSSFVFSAFGLNEIQLGLQVNNLLNTLYANNGYTWGYIYGGQRIVENFLFPQAGVHLLGRISVRF